MAVLDPHAGLLHNDRDDDVPRPAKTRTPQRRPPLSEAPRAPADEQELRQLYADGVRNFAGMKLGGADLVDVVLTDSNLDRCSLGGADLSGATLIEVSFVSARLTRAHFRGAKLWAAALDRANLVGADLGTASLVAASLKDVELRDARLVGTNLSGANLFRARMPGAHLIGADLGGANLLAADLSGSLAMEADFSNTRLWQANLEGADLRNAIMHGASMIGVRLQGANLLGADLTAVDLSDAVMDGTRIDAPPDDVGAATNCSIDAATYFASGWDSYTLAAWVDAGARLRDPENFPPEAVDFVKSRGEGLTLYFRAPLETFDRFLVDAVIFAVLGPDTLARAVEVVPLETRGFVRILAEANDELERIGEAFSHQVWDTGDPPFMEGLLRLPTVNGSLDRLATRLDRIELRGHALEPSVDGGSDEEEARPLTTLRRWMLR